MYEKYAVVLKFYNKFTLSVNNYCKVGMRREIESNHCRILHKSQLWPYVLSLVVGILLEYFLKIKTDRILLLTMPALLISLLIYYFGYTFFTNIRKTSLIIYLITSFSTGLLTMSVYNENDSLLTKIEREYSKKQAIYIIPTQKGYPLEGKIRFKIQDNHWGIKYVSIKTDSQKSLFDPLDTLFIKRCYINSGFLYCKSNELFVKPHKNDNLFNKAYLLKSKHLDLLQNSFSNGVNFGVYLALIFGDKSLLDKEVRKNFANCGIMHLLAVSGLHVGYIFTAITWLLIPLGNYKLSRVIKALIICIVIVYYTFLTGMTPSVIRSAIMIILFTIIKESARDCNTFNNLIICAFITLIFDPLSSVDLGFILSYLSVVSIIFIFPYFKQMLSVKNRLINYIWSSISITIACQIGTFAITSLVFKQFPTYFLISNLITIPLTAIIVFIAVFTPMFMVNDTLMSVAIKLNETLIEILLWVTENISSLPYASVKIGVNLGQSLSIMIVIFCLFFLENRVYRYYGLAGGVFSLLACSL